MDFEDEHFSASASASSSSSSSSSEKPPQNPKTLTPESKPIISQKRKAGRKKFKETRHPIYRGVRQRKGNKWVCEVHEPNKKSRIWLGTFPTPEMAARAHDVAALALRGETAPLNFQDSAWLLKRAKSSSPRDIQMAALAGAMSFGTQEETRAREVMRPSAINVEEEKHVATGTSSSHLNDSSGFSDSSRTMMFVDEEELFNMPGLLDNMAEGLLITPLSMERCFQWGDLNDGDVDLTLWGD